MQRFPWIILFVLVAILMLWQMLLPGYVLTLDMVFTPEYPSLNLSSDGFLNSAPIHLVLQGLNFLLPGWVVQKLVLFMLVVLLGYIPFKFLPLPNSTSDVLARVFAALLYVANPFVYVRLLSGQWPHLLAYALLPIVIHTLQQFDSNKKMKSALKVAGSLFLVSICSVHLFLMALMCSAAWVIVILIRARIVNETGLKSMIKNVVAGIALLIIATSYWTIPGFTRTKPIEQRFSIDHWAAFAAAAHENVPTTLNVLSLNGFWGEREGWARFFIWPQESIIFWIAFATVFALTLLGLYVGIKNPTTRRFSLFLSGVGIFAFVFATGAGETPFRAINLWFYEHVPLWAGFRDGQKFASLLALVYASSAASGASLIFAYVRKRTESLAPTMIAVMFLVPVGFGLYQWGGLQKQLKPVWYPESWFEIKSFIQTQSKTSQNKILTLPWHGYFSLAFNRGLISSNPTKQFFGENVISGRSVELQDIYDQEADPVYTELDRAIVEEREQGSDAVLSAIENNNIRFVVLLKDLQMFNADIYPYEFLHDSRMELLLDQPEIVLYRFSEQQ